MQGFRSRKHNRADLQKKAPTIALIGCGAIAERYYLPALSRHPAIMRQLILVDRNIARARDLADRFHARTSLSDHREAVGAVDAAIIAVPTNLHYPIALEFLSRGAPVLCEKPLAESADKARDMVREAEKKGVALAVNNQRRLFPQLMKVKELLADGSLGEPLSLSYVVGEEFDWPTVSGFYFLSEPSSRGILRDRGCHVMDVICWWLRGKPRLVSSQNDSFGGSEAVAQVRFVHGLCRGEIKLSWLSKFPCKFAIQCENATIEGEEYDFQSVTIQQRGGAKKRVKLSTKTRDFADIAQEMVANFIGVITRGDAPAVAGSHVLDSLEWIDECYQRAMAFDMPWYDILEEQLVSG